MLTVGETIDRTDALVPNPIAREQKMAWLNQLDGLAWEEVIRTHAGEVDAAFAPHETESAEMLIPPPYDEVYHYYLCMKMHLAGREIAAYNNARMLFTSAYVTWQDYYNRVCTPLSQTVGFTL